MKDNRPPKNANLYIATDILKNFSQILSYAERPQKPITIDRGKIKNDTIQIRNHTFYKSAFTLHYNYNRLH